MEKLRDQIEDRGSRLAEIEAEIAKFEADLKVVGAKKRHYSQPSTNSNLSEKK